MSDLLVAGIAGAVIAYVAYKIKLGRPLPERRVSPHDGFWTQGHRNALNNVMNPKRYTNVGIAPPPTTAVYDRAGNLFSVMVNERDNVEPSVAHPGMGQIIG